MTANWIITAEAPGKPLLFWSLLEKWEHFRLCDPKWYDSEAEAQQFADHLELPGYAIKVEFHGDPEAA